MYKIYSFEYNSKRHYLIPTIHIDYSLLDNDLITFIKQIIDNVDTCFFEANANKAIEKANKIKKPKLTKENIFESIYGDSDIHKIKATIKKLFNRDIPISHIKNQSILKLTNPALIISSYDKTQTLTDMQAKQKYLDIFIENKLAIKKNNIELDNITELTKQYTPKYYEDLINLLISSHPDVSIVERSLKALFRLMNLFTNTFKKNIPMKMNIGTDISKEMFLQAEERNIEWIKKIFTYLDKNPTKNIAIIVGAIHIFGINETNKKTGNSLPNLLSKQKNVKNVNYSTL